jgi:uncharacterized protein (TIGR00269 family)
MVRCKTGKCKENAVINTTKPYCKKHFITYFENKVKSTIKKYKLIKKGDKIVIASSGGKDSTTILYLLNKWFGNVTALAVDEGIPGYRNLTIDDLRKFCKKNNIPLKVVSYKKAFGFSLNQALSKTDKIPCNLCGTLRRKLLNTNARGFDKVATGHNLDDEAQSVMMNFMKGNFELAARIGPLTGIVKDEKFVPRVKPLYFCSEKEVATYTFLKNFGIRFTECPHSWKSYRSSVRDFINDLEQIQPGAKHNILVNFLKVLPKLKKKYSKNAEIKHCISCAEPSSREICNACSYVKTLKASLSIN